MFTKKTTVQSKQQDQVKGDFYPQPKQSVMAPATVIPAGVFHVSIDDLRQQVRQGRVEAGPQGLQASNGMPGTGATKVPQGTFHISIDDLRRQVQQGKVEAGPQGIQPSSGFFGSGATKVPKGTFHSNHIAQFQSDAPYANFMGRGEEGDIWVERVTDPITGMSVTLAYTTNDDGRTAQAWCVDPDMKGHTLDDHECHVYKTGELCTDQHGVRRTLAEKRARSVLWVSGFANFLREGRFRLND